MICKDLHGVEQELLLCANERRQPLLKLEPSSNCEDYVAIDSRALLEVDPEKEARDLTEIESLLAKCMNVLAEQSKLDVSEASLARSWLRHARNPDTNEIESACTQMGKEGT